MLLNILTEKWKTKTLGHFYLVESHQDTFNKNLAINQFIFAFLVKVLTINGKTEALAEKLIKGQSHPDLFFVGENQDTNYKVEDLAEFLTFNELAALELKHKFIVIHQAHLLSVNLANKLLKILEEPNKNTTIFLLNPRGGEMLSTIRSRAIKLKLPFVQQTAQLNKDELLVRKVMTDLKDQKYGIAEAMESLKNIDLNSDQEILRVILEEKTQKLDFSHQEKLLKQIQWMKKSEAYRNSVQERVFSLLEFYLT